MRVFLSHAAADGAQARRLRRRLAAMGLPAQNSSGPPQKLHMTLGRGVGAYDAHAAAPLDAELAECDALVVLCSSHTAGDAWVNHAVDTFVSLGRLRRILAVIASNAPDVFDVERDFFPPALAGRGLLAADLRDISRPAGAIGDGFDGGALRLMSALTGVGVERIVQEDGRRRRRTTIGLGAAVAALTATTVLAAGYGAWTHRTALELDAQREVAVRNALQAVQSRDQALAANEAQNQSRERADRRLDRSRERLTQALRSLDQMSTQHLDEIVAGAEATPAALASLRSFEDIYVNLAEASPFLELPPTSMTGAIERLRDSYARIGRQDDAQRVIQRFARLNQRVAGYADADPAWRMSYAAAVVDLATRRGEADDVETQLAALTQAARIVEPICVDAPPPDAPASRAELRATACQRFASIALARATAQEAAELNVETVQLERAKVLLDAAIAAYPDNRRLQDSGARLSGRVARALTRIAEERARPSADPAGQTPG